MPDPSPACTPTVIGPGSHIKGDMAFDSAAKILGVFEGTISSKTELHIGEGGRCRANLDAATIIIDGTVEGDVTARECLQLNAGARLTGDISAVMLVVVQGAAFVGHCRVGPEALTAPARAVPSAPPPSRPRPVPPAPAGPSARMPVATTVSTDLEATLAGLESKLAGMGKARTAATGG